jgi:hypothetical protein
VLELASSTLAMFAGRPAAAQALIDAGAVSTAIKLLSPLFPTVGEKKEEMEEKSAWSCLAAVCWARIAACIRGSW